MKLSRRFIRPYCVKCCEQSCTYVLQGSSRPLVIKFADSKKTNKWKKGPGVEVDSMGQFWPEGVGVEYGYPQSMHIPNPHMIPQQHASRGGRSGLPQHNMIMSSPYGMAYGQQHIMPGGSPTGGQQGGYYFMPGSPVHQPAYFSGGIGGMNYGMISPLSMGVPQQRFTRVHAKSDRGGYDSSNNFGLSGRPEREASIVAAPIVDRDDKSISAQEAIDELNARPPEGLCAFLLRLLHSA